MQPMPAKDLGVRLSQQEIAAFHSRGYAILPQLAPTDEVERMRDALQSLFARQVGRNQGANFDMLGRDEQTRPSALPAIINPSNFAPELRGTQFHANALAVARQLLGDAAMATFDHVIMKPAHTGQATPWHQDEAYRVDASFHYEQLSIWLALQDVPINAGCMEYIEGSNSLQVMRHRSPGDDVRVHAIEYIGEIVSERRVACPVAAGNATVHHGRTLHYAGPNRTDVDRYAYILAFELPPRACSEVRTFAWNEEKRTASHHRRRQWRMRGGVLLEAMRKLERGVWRSPGLMMFEMRRALRALRRL